MDISFVLVAICFPHCAYHGYCLPRMVLTVYLSSCVLCVLVAVLLCADFHVTCSTEKTCLENGIIWVEKKNLCLEDL